MLDYQRINYATTGLLLCLALGACATGQESNQSETSGHPINEPVAVLESKVEPEPQSPAVIAAPADAVTIGQPHAIRKHAARVEQDHAMGMLAQQESRRFSPGPMIQPPPAHWNREGYDHISENRFLSTALNRFSTFSLDVDTASYSNVRRFLKNGRLPPADAVRVEELINYFDYRFPAPVGKYPLSITTDYAVSPWNPQNRLAFIGLQARDMSREQQPKNRLVFLLDTSGSMNQPDKLPLLIRSFQHLTQQLDADDQVAIVTYAGRAGLVLPPTSGENKQAILNALSRLSAGGSTAGGQGITLAYQIAQQQFDPQANNRVILATDGDFNVGASSDGELVRMIEARRDKGIFLTVLGLGSGNYQDAKMQKLADHGNGSHHYLDSDTEAQRVLGEKLVSTLHTVAKDVKLQIEWNPAAVSQYRLIGYENRMLAAEDFRDDRKDAGDLGAGHSVVALYEIVPVGVSATPDIESRYGSPARPGSQAFELGHVKLRYKLPQSSQGIEMEHLMQTAARPVHSASDNLRWASAVAELGMLLRKSEYRGQADYSALIQRAQSAAIGLGNQAILTEFIQLARQASVADQGLAQNHYHD